MSWLFDDDHRALQDRFGTRALADRLEQGDLRRHIGPAEAGFIETRDMFFLSTIDSQGRPTVSYKGGAPGFVAVVLASGEAEEARRQGLIDEESWVARVDAGDREA